MIENAQGIGASSTAQFNNVKFGNVVVVIVIVTAAAAANTARNEIGNGIGIIRLKQLDRCQPLTRCVLVQTSQGLLPVQFAAQPRKLQ